MSPWKLLKSTAITHYKNSLNLDSQKGSRLSGQRDSCATAPTLAAPRSACSRPRDATRRELRVAAPRGRADLSSATARRSAGHSDADRAAAEAISAGSRASSLLEVLAERRVATQCLRHGHHGDGGHAREVCTTRATLRAALVARHTRCRASPSRFVRTSLPLRAPGARKVPPGLNPRGLLARSGQQPERTVSPVRNQGDCPHTCPAPKAQRPVLQWPRRLRPTLCGGHGGPPPTVPEHPKALPPRGPRPTVLPAGAPSLRGPFVKRPTP